MAQLIFRRAIPADAAALADLINNAFGDDRTTEVFVSPDHGPIDVTSRDAVAAKIAEQADTDADSNVIVLVGSLVPDGPPVAHCSVARRAPDTDTAWLGLLAVAPDQHRRGLGSQVLAQAEAHARAGWSARRLEFDVVDARVGLRAWYSQRGYALTGETRPFPYAAHGDSGQEQGLLQPGLQFVLMGKDL